MESKFRSARKASDFTCNKAAKLSGLRPSTYPLREKKPDDFRLKELRGMYAEMNEASRQILLDAAIEVIKGEAQIFNVD